jgi:glucose-1-phosphatase
MHTPIRFLYFDLGNVLLRFCHDRMCRQMAAASGVDERVVRRLVLSEAALRDHETGRLNPVTFHDYFCREAGCTVEFDALRTAAADIFTINVEIVPLVTSLAAAGHRLGVLSNTNEVHWRWVTDGRFAPLLPGPFEHAVLSFEEGAMKPDPRIYEAAAERAGVPPREIFFTDDREENVAAARAAGLDAVLFQDVAQFSDVLRERGVRWGS